TDKGELVIRTEDPNIEVAIRQGGQLVEILDLKSRQTLTLRAGEYEVGLPDEAKGLKLSTGTFTLKRGEKAVVTVERVPPKSTPMAGAGESRGTGVAVPQQPSDILIFSDVSDSVHQVRAFTGHFAGVTHVAFSPDGHLAVSSSVDQTVRVWAVA